MRTARFSDIVRKCGRPKNHLLLVEPEKDKAVQTAVKGGRIMTVFQPAVGSAKDHGEVGLLLGPARLFLIFPRSLKEFSGKRIVGIKYDLFVET